MPDPQSLELLDRSRFQPYSCAGGSPSLMAGYSGTPLVKKLGFRAPMTIVTVDAPAEYQSWLAELPQGVSLVSELHAPITAAHAFVKERRVLQNLLTRFRNELAQDGFVWISWPKKSSKVPTDISEDVIREDALPLGLVDVKVCAVSDVWSGLKLVIRRKERRA